MRPLDVSCRICLCANQTCARARYLAIGVTVTGSHPACNRAAVVLLIFDACLARCARAALSSSAINGRVSLEWNVALLLLQWSLFGVKVVCCRQREFNASVVTETYHCHVLHLKLRPSAVRFKVASFGSSSREETTNDLLILWDDERPHDFTNDLFISVCNLDAEKKNTGNLKKVNKKKADLEI